jgi:hypothetical protein
VSEWQDISTAPRGTPIRVYASYDPSDPLMTWREFVAQDDHGLGWWKTLGRRGLRVYPTHWQPLDAPAPSGSEQR